MTDESISADSSESKKPRFGLRAKVITGAVSIVVIVAGGIVLAMALTEDEPKPPSVKDRTIDMCQDAVLDVLVAPATADFVGAPTADTGGAQVLPVYTVVGEVDAENSFGAMIRNTYTCDVRTGKDKDSWSVESVDVY